MLKEKIKILSGSDFTDPQKLIDDIDLDLSQYAYDQYRFYPSKNKESWEKYFITRFHHLLTNDEWMFFNQKGIKTPYLIGCRISKWDYEHFNIKMANIAVLSSDNNGDSEKTISNILDNCIDKLKSENIEFISTRICGSNISAIHAIESKGFKYFENIIWPVTLCLDVKLEDNSCVRLMNDKDMETALKIARGNTYQSSHFHCDKRFDKDKVNLMHVKWLESAWKANKSIAIIEYNNKVAGYFVFEIDSDLSQAMGYKYGRMQSMALDSNFRGKGLGTKLFSGTISLMKDMGAEYIDSGYSSKNHISAKLHTKYDFYSVYEETTFHLWLQ
ncbi:MAG: GNAT family N-acetyltransferase [Candidatus Zixiibacteriota bacterium]